MLKKFFYISLAALAVGAICVGLEEQENEKYRPKYLDYLKRLKAYLQGDFERQILSEAFIKNELERFEKIFSKARISTHLRQLEPFLRSKSLGAYACEYYHFDEVAEFNEARVRLEADLSLDVPQVAAVCHTFFIKAPYSLIFIQAQTIKAMLELDAGLKFNEIYDLFLAHELGHRVFKIPSVEARFVYEFSKTSLGKEQTDKFLELAGDESAFERARVDFIEEHFAEAFAFHLAGKMYPHLTKKHLERINTAYARTHYGKNAHILNTKTHIAWQAKTECALFKEI